jgi:hypothetical protein
MFFLFGMLASCSAINSSLGIPTLNLDKDHIKNGIYSNKIGECPGFHYFSFTVPQASNGDDYLYMQMKEDRSKNNTYVSLGPSAADFTLYRVMIIAKNHMPFSSFQQHYIPLYAKHIAKIYGAPLQKIVEKETLVHHHPALYVVYIQKIPRYFSVLRLNTVKSTTLTHAIYYINYEKYIVLLWTLGNSNGTMNPVNEHNRMALINGTWGPQTTFVDSFHIY